MRSMPIRKRFVTSNYPKHNRWNIPLVTKKVPGLMKNGLNRTMLFNFIGLRSKQYTCKRDGDENGRKKAKCIKRNFVQKYIYCDEYFKFCKIFQKNLYINRIIFYKGLKLYKLKNA